ncbi:MAG: hypothetical protein ACRD16_14985 [Thermoanaerobaculia bacterium]
MISPAHRYRAPLALILAAGSLSARLAFALHIVPDHPGDSHFTAGPCPDIVPRDGAACPNATTTCPAFYDPSLLPPGYNSVSYCAEVPAGVGFQSPGLTMLTMPMTLQEQQAFLRAGKKVESYVKDDVTVVMEPYKVAYLDSDGNNYIFFAGNEYWNPVCGADASLPPFNTQTPAITTDGNGMYIYQNLPETYTLVLDALKAKNARNKSPLKLVDSLPTQQQIEVEWPATFFAWQQSTNFDGDNVSNFLVGPSGDYPITPGAKPFTLCGSPSTMKMLGLAPLFSANGHTIDDINSPRENMNVTLAGTDGAVVIPDIVRFPPVNSNLSWLYDSTDKRVEQTQLPKAFFEKTYDFYLANQSCDDPTQCRFPAGMDPGEDLIGVFNHEINHVLGVMQSQYYKGQALGTSLTYAYGTALYLLDLYDLDSDFVVSGYGHPGIHSYGDFTFAPRNNDTYEPTTVSYGNTLGDLTPWVQFGSRDHVMVYDVIASAAKYFPLMNYSFSNPDGDIQQQYGSLYTPNAGRIIFIDPELVNLPSLHVVHMNVQASGLKSTINADTIREYSELGTQGWGIKSSTLRKSAYGTRSPLAKWYQTCFDSNGNFTTAKNARCKFSVLPGDLKGLK